MQARYRISESNFKLLALPMRDPNRNVLAAWLKRYSGDVSLANSVASRAIFESTSAIPATVLGPCVVGLLARSVLLCEFCGDIVLPFPIKPISVAVNVWTNFPRSIIDYLDVGWPIITQPSSTRC